MLLSHKYQGKLYSIMPFWKNIYFKTFLIIQSFSDFGIEPGYMKSERKFYICSTELYFMKGSIIRDKPK